MRAKFDARKVLDALRAIIPRGERHGHHDAFLGTYELDSIKDCFEANPVGYAHVEAFEEQIKEACGVRHAFAAASGTAALHLALVAAGVKPGDAVIVPSLTFVGTAAAVVHAGAVPVFVDARTDDFGINPHKLRVFLSRFVRDDGRLVTGERVAAIVPVHLLGRPCQMGPITAAIHEFCPDAVVVEDAAEALGSSYLGRRCGSWGKLAVLSFNNNKIVTTGGGGAVLTDDDGLAARVRSLGTTARVPHAWKVEHSEVGWNYRMPNVCAAMGYAQMERLDLILRAKRALSDAYEGALRSVPGVKFVGEVEHACSNRWLNALIIDPQWRGGRNEIVSMLWDAGIGCREIFNPLHEMIQFKDALRDDQQGSNMVHDRVVCMPSGIGLAMRFA